MYLVAGLVEYCLWVKMVFFGDDGDLVDGDIADGFETGLLSILFVLNVRLGLVCKMCWYIRYEIEEEY